MTTENYNKYYVQGSDHYLIPRDELKLLLRENQKLKEKYENAVADYETTMAEKEQLKRQVEDYKYTLNKNIKLENELFNKRKEYQETYKDVRMEIKEYKTQQQEFIKYLEDDLKEKYRDMGYRHNIYREILQKYKEIIGIDINVGSKGVKDGTK